MKKYVFSNYTSSVYPVDPVFKTKDFSVFGNPMGMEHGPDLFEVNFGQGRIRYCLVRPFEVIDNDEMLLKIKRYLIINNDKNKVKDLVNTYFIGEMEKSIDVSNEFTNQNNILITYEMIEQWYPKTLNDIFSVIIQSVLREQKYLGQYNFFMSLSDDVLFTDPKLSDIEKRNYKMYLQRCMAEEGLISTISDGIHIDCFVLTAKAIASVQNSDIDTNKVAFIAIKFGENEERINVIQNAIAEAGFEPRIMSQVETNNWIMPEIFYQIKNCRFVVADFSLACDGAYYEAGYAAALDKPVIHLFDRREETETNKLHFDIAQKSTIFYSNFDELKIRLINRIKATIK